MGKWRLGSHHPLKRGNDGDKGCQNQSSERHVQHRLNRHREHAKRRTEREKQCDAGNESDTPG